MLHRDRHRIGGEGRCHLLLKLSDVQAVARRVRELAATLAQPLLPRMHQHLGEAQSNPYAGICVGPDAVLQGVFMKLGT